MNAPIILLKTRSIDNNESALSEFGGHFLPHITPEDILLQGDLSKEVIYVLEQYIGWLRYQRGNFLIPNLTAYRDYMLTRPISPTTISRNISVIRLRYDDLCRERDLLFSLIKPDVAWVIKKQLVDELVQRIRDAIHPRAMRVKGEVVQDVADNKFYRLTKAQADELLRKPNLDTLSGIRDCAMIALALCTGVREAELVGLNVPNLRQKLGGELALKVYKGKGGKTRLIPYGEQAWCLDLVDKWLSDAGIDSGAVFRRVHWYATLQRQKVFEGSGQLHPSTFNDILDRYPVLIEDKSVVVRPHDLRRTYALRCYEAGMDIVRIQRNMGHVNSATTLHYIGSLDGPLRRPPALYTNPQMSERSE
jgi:integrase